MASSQPSRPELKGEKAGESKTRLKRVLPKRGKYRPRSAPDKPSTPGQRIRALRIALGFTQQEVATRLLTDQTTVSAWEKDKPKSFAGPSIVALAELLQTTPAALLEGVGFQLPDGPTPNQKLFAQNIHGDLIQLPPDPPAGCLAWIETGETTNSPQLLKKTDALKQIEQALTSKRKIWVIVE